MAGKIIQYLLLICVLQPLFSSDFANFSLFTDESSSPATEHKLKADIYSFMNITSTVENSNTVFFSGTGNYSNTYDKNLIPLLFDINGERVETLWGFDHGDWRILQINVNWNESFLSPLFSKENIFDKIIKYTHGLGLEDNNTEEEDWALEFGLERSYFKNLGVLFDVGLSHIVDKEDLSKRNYHFDTKLRAKLYQNIRIKKDDITLSVYLTGGTGLEINLSNLMDEKEMRQNSYTIDDYYSFPLIASLGFEFSNNKLSPKFIFGMELVYEYESPFSSFFSPVETDLSIETLVPTVYVKWVY